MKKLILSAALVTGSCLGVANADVMALGSAKLEDIGNGASLLSCPGSGFCYDSDRDKLSDIHSGDHIFVHIDGKRVEYVIKSAHANEGGETEVTPADGGDTEIGN